MPEPASISPASPKRALLRILLPVLLMSLAWIYLAHRTPLAAWLDGNGPAARSVRDLGPAGLLAFFVVMVPCMMAGMPRLLFCPVAGVLFGFWPGLLLNIAGPLASHYAVFRFVRWRAGDRRQLDVPAPGLTVLGRKPGFAAVLLAQSAPLPGLVSTVGLAWSGVRDGPYLAGSGIAFAPEAVPLILLGSGSMQPGSYAPARLAAVVVLCAIGAWILLRYIRRRGAETSTSARPTVLQP